MLVRFDHRAALVALAAVLGSLTVAPAAELDAKAVQIIAHSALTLSEPRRRNWRKPRACLIWPNTGSTICFRRR